MFQIGTLLANAWEEGDEVVLVTCRLAKLDMDLFMGTTQSTFEDSKTELYALLYQQL